MEDNSMNPFGAEHFVETEIVYHGGLKYMDPRTGIVYIDGNLYYMA